MSILRTFAAPLAVAAALISVSAAATDIRPYDKAAFQAAQAQKRPIVVFVHAPWCPVCKVQMKVMDEVTAAPAYKNLVVFRIDYDTQKPLWQSFGATQQSTMIGFHGTRETGRIAHETDAAKITGVLAKTLS